ncbi:hypothetical protein [Fluviicola sp.]|uniref:hypothetical protein n=1 Tax=Fluviicola sp. TaxID=1917219 RepID=UPI0028206702|nr:hypothetical protein [Fluviicola sp.]MDR0801844.1 hypothetical protein [Fluviicola sp.]
MTPEEIYTFLRIEDLSEAEDALEMELFELKKSILLKPLLRQTLRSKILRLEKLSEIATSLNLPDGNQLQAFEFNPVKTDEVLQLWETYMKAKSNWKKLFSQVSVPWQAIELLGQGLEMELAFSARFENRDWIEEEPVFGTEPDPMPVQNGLKQAWEQGVKTFPELEKNKSELPKELLLALKRLSLLPKYLKL